MKIKVQLHFHTGEDPLDNFIDYSPYEAIDYCSKLGFKVISFTHHNKLLFDEDRARYAFDKGIILVPGVELAIKKKHVLVLNSDEKVNSIKTFKDLAQYKKLNPDILLIAPHPFYPGIFCLGKSLEKYKKLFDAVEFSFYYFKRFGNKYNFLAQKFACLNNIPIIGNADAHTLKFVDKTYSFLDVDFDPEKINYKNRKQYIQKVFDSIRHNRIEIVSEPLYASQFRKYNMFMMKEWTKRFVKKYGPKIRFGVVNKKKK